MAAGHFRRGVDGLTLSSVGLGTYLGRPDGATDGLVETAVQVGLRSGRVNVVDTAINYRFQRAERSVGRALARAVAAKHVGREAVFISTKAGYLAPDIESDVPPEEWVERTLVRTGVLRPDDIVEGCHSMAPDYLVDQIERSRNNLGLETLDLVYLHNAPDTQLPVVGPIEFGRRLRQAFTTLEELRRRGTIGSYGLATWDSLRVAPDDPSYLSLELAVNMARDAGGSSHGFRSIQFPFNLAMPEAASSANQPVGGRTVPLFEAASALGIACFTSIPLVQGQLARSGPTDRTLSRAQTALQFARSAPGSRAALVGAKGPEHLSEDLQLAEVAPWSPETFQQRLREWGRGPTHPRR
ncbi:MAG TPA: aldo/keto reductase [Thermoplasmata archaeon]|nr:aldo/keto reductase [Thermoplasmata archaeon]